MSEFYRMDPARWNHGTDCLSLEQEAAFLRIVNAIHIADEPIRNSVHVLAGLFRCGAQKARRLRDELIAAGKIEIIDGLIHNRRADAELAFRKRVSRAEVAPHLARSCSAVGPQLARSYAETPSNPLKSNETASSNRIEENISSSLRSDDSTPPLEKTTAKTELETVLDAEHAEAVIEHRRKKRAPLTVRAAKMLAKKLAEWPDPNAAADAMLVAGWTGFEPEWLERRSLPLGTGPPGGNGGMTAWQRTTKAFEGIRSELFPDRSDEGSPGPLFGLPSPGTNRQ